MPYELNLLYLKNKEIFLPLGVQGGEFCGFQHFYVLKVKEKSTFYTDSQSNIENNFEGP
jgi:hypothetical protein